uniref:Uncharacterized protein n=1 Tax=Oryza barthii TaxID=65489 RepID=A0A0D3EQF4_9ORYZ
MQKMVQEEAEQVDVLASGAEEAILCLHSCLRWKDIVSIVASQGATVALHYKASKPEQQTTCAGEDTTTRWRGMGWRPAEEGSSSGTSSTQSLTSILGQQNSHAEDTWERNGEEGGVGVVFFRTNSTCASAGRGDD